MSLPHIPPLHPNEDTIPLHLLTCEPEPPAKPQHRTAPLPGTEHQPPWWAGMHVCVCVCVSPGRQTLCLPDCPTKTPSSSLRLCAFLLCQSLNLLCNGFGEEALDVGCHRGFMSHDRCRSACPLIVSCGSRCHKRRLRLSSSGAN